MLKLIVLISYKDHLSNQKITVEVSFESCNIFNASTGLAQRGEATPTEGNPHAPNKIGQKKICFEHRGPQHKFLFPVIF